MRYFLTILVVLIGLALLPVSSRAHAGKPDRKLKAKEGVLDLRGQDIREKNYVLNGEWAFYWKQLLVPGQIPAQPTHYIQYPSRWDSISLDGQQLPSHGFATYTLRILLPPNHPALSMEVPDAYCSYRLYVNGSVASQNGVPDSTVEAATPFWATRMIPLPSGTDTLDLVLQVANFWHNKGGSYKEILIGESQQLNLKHLQDISFDLLLAGCLVMGGLFFFGFFLFGKRDKAILYFSLFCLTYSYRMIGTDLYVLHTILPGMSWFFTIKLEYLSLVISVSLFARYIRCLYPADVHKPVIFAVIWFCQIYALVILLTPPVIFTQGINLFLVVMFFYIAYAFYVCILAARLNRVGASFALLSCCVMLLVFFIINLDYFNLFIPPRWVVFAGYILFFFLQSLVLSNRFASTLKKAAEDARLGLQAKSDFMSTMSHEIRTPLNVVIGMTHLLLRNKPRKDQEENLEVLLFSAKNLLGIVNDILDYNKIEAGKISFETVPMDISTILKNISGGLQNKASEKRITLQLDMDERITHKVIGDPTRLSQVLYNLVNNAVKFTEKGWVKLSVQLKDINDTQVTLQFSVKDTGIGIDREKQEMIFERFTQADSSVSRSFGGTGLGLAITKGILALQNISLHLESEPGKGSEFYFTQIFPLSTEEADNEQQGEHIHQKENLNGIRFLVVEDNPFNVAVVQSLLEQAGAGVEVAENGREALEKVTPGKYHIILMDLNMPVMDGFEATRQLRSRGETLPILALTATLPSEIENDVKAAGLNDIIVKPFNPEDLFRVIHSYLHSVSV